MDNYLNDINNIFAKYATINDIKEKTEKKTNAKTNIKRKKSCTVTPLDALEYFFHYSGINSTKMEARATTNIDNGNNFSRSSYERHIKKIPITTFIDLYKEIIELYKKYVSTDNKINKILNGYDSKIDLLTKNLGAVDGVCSTEVKNNKLFTNQNLFLLDLSLNIPSDFIDNNEICVFDNNKNNKSNKNHESVVFNNYLDNNKNKDKIKNKIYVNDRAYFSYQLVNKMVKNINNNNSFIFRVKDNLDIIDDTIKEGNCKVKHIETKDKIKNMIVNNPNIRVIKYSTLSQMTIKKKNKKKPKKPKYTKKPKDAKKPKDTKKPKDDNNSNSNKDADKLKNDNKDVDKLKNDNDNKDADKLKNDNNNKDAETLTFDTTNFCYLITNLPEHDYNDEVIKLLYSLRWNIEVYFKYVKNNFKFDTFYLEDKDEISKLKYTEMIIFILNKLLYIKCLENRYKKHPEKFSNTIIDKKTKKIKNVTIRINTTLSLTGFYNLLLNKIIRGNLTEKELKQYNSQYIIIIRNEKGRSFNRESLIPYSKWYIKKFHKIYEFNKIITAIKSNTIDKLNKNLKLKAKTLVESLNDNKEILEKIYSFVAQ